MRRITLSGGPLDGRTKTVLYGRALIDSETGARYEPHPGNAFAPEVWRYVEGSARGDEPGLFTASDADKPLADMSREELLDVIDTLTRRIEQAVAALGSRAEP